MIKNRIIINQKTVKTSNEFEALKSSAKELDEEILNDMKRTEFLEKYGLKVIRIPNVLIKKDFGYVCAYIDDVVQNVQPYQQAYELLPYSQMVFLRK